MSWTPEELDPESDQIRQVYAVFGSAIYFAQVLEHGLANLVVVAQIGSKLKTHEAIDARWDELFRLTMGGQLREALEAAEFSEEEIEQLKAALTTRNFLAHDYFRERATEFLSFAGRNKMIDELQAMRHQFEDADDVLEPRTDKFAARFGATPELRDQVLAEMRRAHDDSFSE